MWARLNGALAAFARAPCLRAVTLAVTLSWPAPDQRDFPFYEQEIRAVERALLKCAALQTVVVVDQDRAPLHVEEQGALAKLMPALRQAGALRFSGALRRLRV